MIKNPPANAGDARGVGSVRSPRVGYGNPLQHSCLENSMTESWWAIAQGVSKSLILLSVHTHIHPPKLLSIRAQPSVPKTYSEHTLAYSWAKPSNVKPVL